MAFLTAAFANINSLNILIDSIKNKEKLKTILTKSSEHVSSSFSEIPALRFIIRQNFCKRML